VVVVVVVVMVVGEREGKERVTIIQTNKQQTPERTAVKTTCLDFDGVRHDLGVQLR